MQARLAADVTLAPTKWPSRTAYSNDSCNRSGAVGLALLQPEFHQGGLQQSHFHWG